MKEAAKGITHQLELITPAKAEKYLNHNKTNRTLRNGVAEKYEADMKAGKWTQCVAPIVFYKDGDVADGQHRLWAVVGSGVAQEFIVVRGLDREAGLNIDTGFGRSLVDNAKISGNEGSISHQLISTCKAIEQGDKIKGATSNAEQLAFIERHREAAEWAIHNGPRGKYLLNATVLSAIARAWYVEPDKERLKQFAHVLTTGFSEGEKDTAAVSLRNYMQGMGSAGRVHSTWRPMFLKVQNAIWSFMRGRKLTQIKPIADERYPLIAGIKPALGKRPVSKIGKLAAAKKKELAKKEK